MKRKIILRLLAYLIGFAIGMAIAHQADAFTIRQIRSLSAAGSVTNGISFDGSTPAQMPPPGGGLQWNVLITGSAPNLTFQVQGQMTDGTWVPISQTPNLPASIVLAGSLPANGQNYSFYGPYQNVRVAITAWTSGTLTADIYVMY